MNKLSRWATAPAILMVASIVCTQADTQEALGSTTSGHIDNTVNVTQLAANAGINLATSLANAASTTALTHERRN